MRDHPPLRRWIRPRGEDGPGDRLLFMGSLLGIGEFRCEPGGPGWNEEARTGPFPMVVFPGPGVLIRLEGRGTAVANRTAAVFYEPHQVYRREPLEGRGDHCIHVSASPALLAEIGGERDPAVAEPEAFSFPSASGPVGSDAFLLQRRIARYVLAEPDADALLVEEAMIRVLGWVVGAAFELSASRPSARRTRTRQGHADAVVEAGSFLTRRFADPVSLADVARVAHLSPFHLARVFRGSTGYTLHGYRTHLRLRYAAERLLADRADLVDVAAEAGFASHAHLTDSFRRAFGRPPSAIRTASDLAEVRRIVEAPPSATP